MLLAERNKLIYKYDNETICIEAWGKDGLRVRSTKNPTFTEHDWALDLEPVDVEAKVNIVDLADGSDDPMLMLTANTAVVAVGTITNGEISATIDELACVTFKNAAGEVLLQEDWRRLKDNPSMALNRPARAYKVNSGNSFSTTLRFKSNDNEMIFGMGQYQQKQLNLKGCSLELAHRNSQASVPFYISSLGYGFLWNNPAIGKATFANNGTEWFAESTPQIDYWITAASTPALIEENFADVVGKVPMMPDYGMGFWQCKLRYKSQEELLNVAREFNRLEIPLDVIVADFFHWTQQGEYKFDPKYWPDVKGMCEELDAMGIKLMVSIWPTVDYRSENFAEMLEKGYLVRTEHGVRITMQLFGQEVFMDPTNPGTRDFVWKKCKENYWDNGVRLFWLDEAEPEYTVYDYENYRYYLGSNLEVGNIYPREYAHGFYDGMVEAGMENPVNLLRCAWVGSQKYGALCWSGDIDSTWDAFQRQIRAGLSMGIAGIPWWTADIGGFHGAYTDDPKFRQLLIRWFQYGCFNPVFRLHGNRYPMTGFEGDMISGTGAFGSGADNEIWSYGEEAYNIMKYYIELRERMRPYVENVMKQAHEKGTPIMRTMFYAFPDDVNAWEIDDQYMFGDDMLVAPVIEEDSISRQVYLPIGAKWTNAWTDEVYEGGQFITIEAPLEQIPVLFRDDYKLPIKV